MSAREPLTLTVRDVMSDQLVSVSAACRIEDALDTILGTGLRHLVVVDPLGRCRGVVTSESVAMAVIASSLTSATMRSVSCAAAGPAASAVRATSTSQENRRANCDMVR